VRFHHSDGHTPGLLLAEIVGPDLVQGEAHGGVVFCADLIPGRPWVHVPITMGYDRNAELLIDEKRAFLQDKLARDVHLFFTHDPGCALARVVRDDKGRFGTTHEHAELRARAMAA
jgi:glyoxylase-like metal-dependent hydrolase (beta-lactamase superfamily II)